MKDNGKPTLKVEPGYSVALRSVTPQILAEGLYASASRETGPVPTVSVRTALGDFACTPWHAVLLQLGDVVQTGKDLKLDAYMIVDARGKPFWWIAEPGKLPGLMISGLIDDKKGEC